MTGVAGLLSGIRLVAASCTGTGRGAAIMRRSDETVGTSSDRREDKKYSWLSRQILFAPLGPAEGRGKRAFGEGPVTGLNAVQLRRGAAESNAHTHTHTHTGEGHAHYHVFRPLECFLAHVCAEEERQLHLVVASASKFI